MSDDKTITSDSAATGTITGETTDTDTYTPVFNATVRTIIYVVTLIAGIVGLGVSAFGDPQVGAFISSAAGIIAAAFGVTYSPMRLDTKYDGRFLPSRSPSGTISTLIQNSAPPGIAGSSHRA